MKPTIKKKARVKRMNLMKTIKIIMSDMRITGHHRLWTCTCQLRIMDEEVETFKTESIKPGSKSMCHASVQLLLDYHKIKSRRVKAKLDSCGSVSIAHSNLLNSIKPSRSYNLPNIRLRGIGGKTKHAAKGRGLEDKATWQ